jgi:hypothetical protein
MLVTGMITITGVFLTIENTQLYTIAIYNGREISRGVNVKYTYIPGTCTVWTNKTLPVRCEVIIGSLVNISSTYGDCYDSDVCVTWRRECKDERRCRGGARSCRIIQLCRDICAKLMPCSMKYRATDFQYIISRNEDDHGNGVFERVECPVSSPDSPWICNATIAKNLTVYIPMVGFDPKNYRSHITAPYYAPVIAYIVCLVVSVILVMVSASAYLMYYDTVSNVSTLFFACPDTPNKPQTRM